LYRGVVTCRVVMLAKLWTHPVGLASWYTESRKRRAQVLAVVTVPHARPSHLLYRTWARQANRKKGTGRAGRVWLIARWPESNLGVLRGHPRNTALWGEALGIAGHTGPSAM
jgi:hypothetical protein